MSLPNGYRRLEYIQSTGTQYINTGFAPNQSTRVVCDTVFAAVSVGAWLFGARHANTDRTFGFLTFEKNYRSDFNASSNETITETQSGRFTVDKDGNITKINGSTVKTAAAGTFQCSHSLFLFANNNNGTVGGYGKATVYSCQIYDNGTLVRDFIPCKNTGGAVGLWDDVNSVFYGNAGTGTFTAGPVIAIATDKSEVRELEYIQSSGKQYINTGFKPTGSTKVVCDFQMLNQGSSQQGVFGSRPGTSGRFTVFTGYGTTDLQVDYNTEQTLASVGSSITGLNVNSRTTLEVSNSLVINGTTVKTVSATSFTSTYNLFLFANNNAGTAQLPGAMKLYACKIYDKNTLVRDFVPCINASGEVGLYDLVEKMFYINAGTGTFISGGYTSLKTGDILNYAYTGAVQSVTLPKGVYKLEVWGAQGGSYSSYYGGAGGYSVGVLTLTANTTNLFVYVGGQPTTSTSSSVTIAGGFNGGGKARYHSYSGTTTYCQAGGGGSDIRIGTDSLYARVIVAGGGGGSASVNAKTTKYGGGTSGGSPQSGYAASQTSAGTNGSFGVGADGYISGYNYKYASGGGGGGWYGGGAINKHSDSTNYRGYNGGGSGFVWIGSNAPSGYLLGPEYYLTDASTIAGNASMPSTSGGTETGHTGHGYARITVIKVDSLNLPVNIGGTWKEANEAFVNIGGTWKTVEAAFVNIGGTWKELG